MLLDKNLFFPLLADKNTTFFLILKGFAYLCRITIIKREKHEYGTRIN